MRLIEEDLTGKILKAFYNVYNKLGFGFLEKVYENALLLELRSLGLSSHRQVPLKVYYNTFPVGEYFADIIINDSVIIELKAAESLAEEHELQLINYLKATEIEVGLLLNFGKKPAFRRKIFTNDLKKIVRIRNNGVMGVLFTGEEAQLSPMCDCFKESQAKGIKSVFIRPIRVIRVPFSKLHRRLQRFIPPLVLHLCFIPFLEFGQGLHIAFHGRNSIIPDL